MVITGDLSQVDLPAGQPSGLAEAVSLLDNIKGVGMIHLSGQDVVRHPVVARIVEAYEAFEQKEQIEKAAKEKAYQEREQKRQLAAQDNLSQQK